MSNKLLFRLVVLMTAMMCALGASAQEAYACYTPSNTTLTFYFDTERSSRPGTTYNLNTSNDGITQWRGISQSVTQVVFDPSFAEARRDGTNSWFSGMSQLTSIIGIEYLNTSEVVSMWSTFDGCSALTSLDVSHFDTRKVREMNRLFNGCSALTSLDVSSFNTANVTSMNSMFSGCSGLTSLDMSGFNTAKVTDMGWMFLECTSLTSLDVSDFNTAKVTVMTGMFNSCSNLTTIYAGDGWSTAAVTRSDYMFGGCTSLVGGQGTTYRSGYATADYAHIDGGPSNPGYFTEKPSFIRGDVNGDGQVKIGDVTALINYLLSGDTSSINLQAADCNQNGEIKIGDVTALINYLLSGTWN